MSIIEVDYDCCSAHYEFPAALHDNQLLLANASLADTIIMWADAAHDNDHPECEN
jgi:hypothetical protein